MSLPGLDVWIEGTAPDPGTATGSCPNCGAELTYEGDCTASCDECLRCHAQPAQGASDFCKGCWPVISADAACELPHVGGAK